MSDDLIMRKSPESIELEFHDSGESTLIKGRIISDLQNSPWEASVRNEVKKFLSKAGDDVTTKEVFDAVKDMARRDVPQDIKKKLYEQILEIPGALATSRFFCTFFFHLQNITGFSLYLHRLLTAMYSKSETYWKKYYCFVPIGGCLYSLVVLSPWYIFSNFYLRMETENGVLRKIYNTKLATISYSINPIFAMFYFLMVLLTGIWTSKIVATNNNSKINEFMARKMTIVATVNGILMSGNLIFTVVLTIIILSPIKSYGHTYSNTVVTFTSDMYTLAMPYILLFFDGNVQRLMRLADPEKPIRSTRVYMVRN
ncbi:unnamed protein product [Caenorhabditis angaria]|uniref:Serpentine receptor class gamma n=1 Tax=Caenorhabditis angaria TaxID=860376 RepID=A0A9P1N599_9PELO|nr:unnamed protein product [Caenorhabditis angaria]